MLAGPLFHFPFKPMNTEILPTHTPALFDAAVKRATELLRAGEVVALPTETVYGLAANALDEKAVTKIFRIKDRPANNPIIVHIASVEMAKRCVTAWPNPAEKLARAFWPGPLTLVLPCAKEIPGRVTAGGKTVDRAHRRLGPRRGKDLRRIRPCLPGRAAAPGPGPVTRADDRRPAGGRRPHARAQAEHGHARVDAVGLRFRPGRPVAGGIRSRRGSGSGPAGRAARRRRRGGGPAVRRVEPGGESRSAGRGPAARPRAQPGPVPPRRQRQPRAALIPGRRGRPPARPGRGRGQGPPGARRFPPRHR